MKNGKKYLMLASLALGQGAVYFLPYLRATYYNPLLEILNVSNSELGSLVSFFAIGCMILYIPGGICSDKWNYKKCIVWSLLSTALLVGSFAFMMNFSYARIVWFLMAFTTTFVFWSSALKAVRAIGDEDNQGKTYGFYYFAQGLLSIITQNILLFVFNSIANQAFGLKVVLLGNAAINLVAAISCYFLLDDPKKEGSKLAETNNQFDFKKIGSVIKSPFIWLIALLVFCSYGLYSNSYYYSTYLINIKGMSQYWGAQLSLIRTTYMMCIASYIGGFFADKLRSTAKLFAIGTTAAAVFCFLITALCGSDINIFVLGVLSILPAACMLSVYGLNSSLYEEFKIPMSVTGTAIGLVSIIGYTPDLFFGPLLGGWLDKQRDAGYITIFIFFGALCVAGAILSLVALKLKKHHIVAK